MSPKTAIRVRVAKWPLIAVTIVALSIMSAVVLMAAIAWTTFGYRTTATKYLADVVTESAVAVNDTSAVTEFGIQSGMYPYNI